MHKAIGTQMGKLVSVVLCIVLLFTSIPMNSMLADDTIWSGVPIEDPEGHFYLPGILRVIIIDGLRIQRADLKKKELLFPGV